MPNHYPMPPAGGGLLPEPVELPVDFETMKALANVPLHMLQMEIERRLNQPPPPQEQTGPSRQPTPPWVQPPTMHPANTPPVGQFVNPFSMSNQSNLPPAVPGLNPQGFAPMGRR